MNKVDVVVLVLDGIKIHPCWEVGSGTNCTKQLSGKIYRGRQYGYKNTYMNACTYHVVTIGEGGSHWEEVLSS